MKPILGVIFDMDGNRIPNHYALLGVGQSEYFAFEPYLNTPDSDYLACVTKMDSELPADSAYTLTIVDFAQ